MANCAAICKWLLYIGLKLPSADSGHSTSGNVDRIQQLRMEYQQAKREGFPLYESEDVAGRFLEYDQSWVSLLHSIEMNFK
ncbi:hypothetical protein GDO78_002541 [Eleutherodactylus coqui]|uniref:Uncharacterized protein n=1 Tax=Eleutherodactylus coqui TaxID=57060 RepID=A0A8J6EYY0_ELECQ|nr:hypothetical protein GDO78_002541 [Eleutherodactylus coqui]